MIRYYIGENCFYKERETRIWRNAFDENGKARVRVKLLIKDLRQNVHIMLLIKKVKAMV